MDTTTLATSHGDHQPFCGFTREEDRWAALRARDQAADGAFFYAVRTTSVYCYPSCAARPALRENVAFFAIRDEAERAGFRPCNDAGQTFHPEHSGKRPWWPEPAS